jgi:hypothetical protein
MDGNPAILINTERPLAARTDGLSYNEEDGLRGPMAFHSKTEAVGFRAIIFL